MKKLIAILIIAFLSGCISEKGKEKIVVIETKLGNIEIKLYEDEMPKTVSNFIKLVEDGFYDGLIFHRIVRDFVIQGGAFYPNGTYKESPYGTIPLEISANLKHDKGAVGMARASEPDSASSQFYICVTPQHQLDGSYAVFGKVIKGMDVVEKISKYDPDYTYTIYPGYSNWPKKEIIENVTMIRVYMK